MKTCSSCKQDKDESEFFKNATTKKDGLSNQCKRCHTNATYKWRVRNGEKARKISREGKARQRKREGIKATRAKWNAWYQNNLEHRRSYSIRKSDPVKTKTHNALQHALRSVKIIRPNQCSKCAKHCKPDAHHPNYKQPLRVIWLCRKCHRLLQNK
jgi:hypothetical protein